MGGPRRGPVSFECLQCGISVMRARTKIKKGKPAFCSISCAAKKQVRPKDFGTGFIDKNGYRLLKRNGKYTPEHRLVMEAKVGRPLRDFENVHHVNGQRLDNSPDNLEIWNTKHPSGQRVADKVSFAIEMLRLYPQEARAAGARLLYVVQNQDDGAAALLSSVA